MHRIMPIARRGQLSGMTAIPIHSKVVMEVIQERKPETSRKPEPIM